jgi:hypothetical protein
MMIRTNNRRNDMIRISIYSVNLASYISRCALQHRLAAAALKGIIGYMVIISDIRGLKGSAN